MKQIINEKQSINQWLYENFSNWKSENRQPQIENLNKTEKIVEMKQNIIRGKVTNRDMKDKIPLKILNGINNLMQIKLENYTTENFHKTLNQIVRFQIKCYMCLM